MTSIIASLIPKIVPVFLLVALGIFARRKSILSVSTVDDLKKVIINLVLPCVLYFSFLSLELKSSYIFLIVGMFITCLLLLALGYATKPLIRSKSAYTPMLFTGFEFGMMGASLFGAVFGIDKVAHIALIGLGHEFFIWFVFVTLLTIKRDGQSNLADTTKSFIKSPVIIAIILGITINLTGLAATLEQYAVIQALYNAMHFLEKLIVPLILLILGFGLDFKQIKLRTGISIVAIRLGLLIPFALIVNRWFIRQFLGLDVLYEAAVFIFFILPPPFIIPLYMRKDQQSDQADINGLLLIYSLCSIIAFSAYYAYFVAVHGG